MIRLSVRSLVFLIAIISFAVTPTPGLKRAGTAAAIQFDPPPSAATKVGTESAGSFADATGHSTQSHLVYAANAGVWWLFTLTSSADSVGLSGHIVKAYRSSGADLATAVWTAASDSPGASAYAGFAPNGFMGSGRALGIAYVNNPPDDVIHAEVALAADGQDGITGHIRARLTATGITWERWNYHVEGAATWTLPRAVSLGLSNGKFIHSGGPTLQQEVDANARRSTNADTGSDWTPGFSSVVVIDNSMLHQCNALAFAALSGETMLAVYDDGRGTEPGKTNLRYKRSNPRGSWAGVVVGSQLGGDGDVFGTTASIDQNDWTLVSLNPETIRAYRRNAAGTGVDAAAYEASTNAWSAAPAPPPFGAGQAFKRGAGLFGANDGTATWLFAVNTDAANTILYTKHDGASWSAWAPVPGTDSGTHSRRFLSGQPVAAEGQIGLIWTEGTTSFDIFAAALVTVPDTAAPTVSLVAPADGSTVFGNVAISARASDNRAFTVQFQLDGADLGAPQTTAPFDVKWDSRTVPNGTHSITAIATDTSGNAATASASVSVDNRPVISAVSATRLNRSSAAITWTTDVAATSVVEFGETMDYGASVSDEALVTNHQVTLSGLAAGTTYHYRVTSADADGNPASAGDFTFATEVADTTVPTVAIRAPADGVTVSGTGVTFSASADDNIGVLGVQFQLDGAALGAEDTTSPYSISWNSTTAANGVHAVSATARDAAGNTATAAISVTVSNITDITLPTIRARTPAPDAIGVATATTVTAMFSEAMNPATITGTTFSLRTAADTLVDALVDATVDYDSTTQVATLTPSAALAAGQTYTATMAGGPSGVNDAAGNALAADWVWSFTTAEASPAASSITIWSESATPDAFATDDNSEVELGLRFRADVPGRITGVRFYKGTSTTGTYTATLWTNGGTALATATFTAETAGGWQQVNFATPVAIAANTVYVVSYHTNVGSYAYTHNYFASEGSDNGPLHALRSSGSSGNGVYQYDSSIVFPDSTFRSTNYWVDVVFVPALGSASLAPSNSTGNVKR
jgi:Domain of unknown function (DUF4082)/Bacterial Ig-like domain/Bacterial Ig domain